MSINFKEALNNSLQKRELLEKMIDKKDDQGVDASTERKKLDKTNKQIKNLEFTIKLGKEK